MDFLLYATVEQFGSRYLGRHMLEFLFFDWIQIDASSKCSVAERIESLSVLSSIVEDLSLLGIV
jgi:hypothetical protein